jgi:hypothetical protein
MIGAAVLVGNWLVTVPVAATDTMAPKEFVWVVKTVT